jgi:DNA-binding MarR family transcriptional regulator
MGVDPSTIQRHIRALEKRGLLRRIERRGSTKATQTNAYDLTPLVERLKGEAEQLAELRRERSQ